MVAADLVDAVATEFLEERVGQDDRHHRLAHDAGRRHRADVTALDDGLDGFLGREIDRFEGRPQRRERLHGGTHDHGLAVGHPTLEASGVVARAPKATVGVEEDLVVDGGARAPRCLEAEAQLDALDGLNGGEGLGEAAVETPIPLHVGAEPDRTAEGDDLEDATQRVALGLRVVDGRDDGRLGLRMSAADLRGLRALLDLVPRHLEVEGRSDAADLGDVTEDRDPEFRQQALGHARHRDPRGRLASAGALEHVADVAVAVLHRAREVCVPGARARHFLVRGARLGRSDRHRGFPVLPVSIRDL